MSKEVALKNLQDSGLVKDSSKYDSLSIKEIEELIAGHESAVKKAAEKAAKDAAKEAKEKSEQNFASVKDALDQKVKTLEEDLAKAGENTVPAKKPEEVYKDLCDNHPDVIKGKLNEEIVGRRRREQEIRDMKSKYNALANEMLELGK